MTDVSSCAYSLASAAESLKKAQDVYEKALSARNDALASFKACEIAMAEAIKEVRADVGLIAEPTPNADFAP